MAPVTEVVYIILMPNADYGAIEESVKIMARQPGCLTARASRLQEEPDKVHCFIDWDSVDSHLAFARNKEVYGPFRALVGTVMAGFAPPYHVELSPYPPTVFDGGATPRRGKRSGVVMIGKAWFPGGPALTAEETEAVTAAFGTFVKALRDRGVKGFTGRVAHGWSLEDGILYQGQESRVFVFAVGWESIEAYLRFRDSAQFRDIGSVMTSLNKLEELEYCSINTTDTDTTS
ncbi:hypothetical protein F5Y12DRAFT_741695 [Xylaria sp. FL1777]|nr:hypothetical protein F5Y12DRAFT_741695 [Xylaria sp. FL1777]